ncbi:hypothetical protein EOM81_10085 [bacterium]|nr:hypothetical protein [bacterium]
MNVESARELENALLVVDQENLTMRQLLAVAPGKKKINVHFVVQRVNVVSVTEKDRSDFSSTPRFKLTLEFV